jgi:hypothetical protein
MYQDKLLAQMCPKTMLQNWNKNNQQLCNYGSMEKINGLEGKY